jgi:hypothetical protein
MSVCYYVLGLCKSKNFQDLTKKKNQTQLNSNADFPVLNFSNFQTTTSAFYSNVQITQSTMTEDIKQKVKLSS